MTCLSQSEQCRGEPFRPNERSLANLHHSDFARCFKLLQLQHLITKTRYRYLLYCNKNQASPGLSCNQKCKMDISSITLVRTFNLMYARY